MLSFPIYVQLYKYACTHDDDNNDNNNNNKYINELFDL